MMLCFCSFCIFSISLLSFLITALFLQLPFFLSATRALSCLNLSGAFRGNKFLSQPSFCSHILLPQAHSLILAAFVLMQSVSCRQWETEELRQNIRNRDIPSFVLLCRCVISDESIAALHASRWFSSLTALFPVEKVVFVEASQACILFSGVRCC